jgi:hypothetical protein
LNQDCPSLERPGVRTRFDAAWPIAALLSAAIFAYVLVRAATLSITHDEALTWAWHARGGWLDIVLFRTPGLPDNNHVLHTLLCKLSTTMFGVSELSLRLPSLFGALLFLVGLNLCLRRLVPGWVGVIGVLALGLNPYVVDYLGIARGYGLGLGFTMAGLAALLAALRDAPAAVRAGPARLAVALFSLAALSNLSFLLVLGAGLVVLAVPTLYAAWRVRDAARGRGWLALVALVALAAPAAPVLAYLPLPMQVIREKGLFDIGGHSGFWTDTVGSLVTGTVHGAPWLGESAWPLQAWVVASLVLLPWALRAVARVDRRRGVALGAVATMTGVVAAASRCACAFTGPSSPPPASTGARCRCSPCCCRSTARASRRRPTCTTPSPTSRTRWRRSGRVRWRGGRSHRRSSRSGRDRIPAQRRGSSCRADRRRGAAPGHLPRPARRAGRALL